MTDETTREAVRRLVGEHPEYNQSDLARELGVSRERVRQIVESEGLTTARYKRGIGPRAAKPPVSRVITGGTAVPINHTVAGVVAELLVSADLMARGYTVFFPLSRTSACDIVTLDVRSRVERIEVRCGTRTEGGVIRFNKPDTSLSDRRAIVITGEPVVYDPPMQGDPKGPCKGRGVRRFTP